MVTARDNRSLRSQLVIGLVAVVFITATLVSIPAIWLIRSQLDGQTWQQIAQGVQATKALYAAKQSETTNIVALIAQRPTLRSLIAQGDREGLQSYMAALRSDTELDLVAVCDGRDALAVYAVQQLPGSVCNLTPTPGYQVIRDGHAVQVWLFAFHSINDAGARPLNVIGGRRLDQSFALEMQEQTGLEDIVWVGEMPVAASLKSDSAASLAEISQRRRRIGETDGFEQDAFEFNGQPYYSTRISIGDPAVQVELVLPITDTLAAQGRLIGILAGGVTAAAGVSAALVALLARQLSRPLTQLAESAVIMSTSDLSRPITISVSTREVAAVAQALERARLDLQQTLGRLQHERDWADHLLESIVEGIVTLDHEGRISYFSAGAERISGWKSEEVSHRPVDDLFKLSDQAAPFSDQMPEPGQRAKLAVTLANGGHAVLAITGARLAPAQAGDATRIFVFRDVSDEEAVHRLLGQFLGTVAHEFKTPLSAVAASIELLQDQVADLTAAELDELLTSLRLGILRLQTLVDNLLESANIESRRFRVSPRPCELDAILAEAVQMMQPLLTKYGQRIRMDVPDAIPLVCADSRRTAQVLVNLLSNASRHGPHDREIGIGVTIADNAVRVHVADRGPGILPQYREEVFRRFVRPGIRDDSDRAGAGLGLSVVKAVVEAQGGQVGVEDHPGGGSLFWFSVPMANKQ